ncbi:MAG: MFS transporter [Phycisphaerales bacterium JB063]
MESTSSSTLGVNVRLSAMMFLEFFVWGAWYVTMGPYMAANDMSDQIGNAYSVGPVAAIIAPFFLGLIADRFFRSEHVLAALMFLAGGLMFVAPFVTGWAFIAVIFAHMLCFMPTLGLTNTVAFHNILKPESWFPIIRVLGTIGWIVAGFVISGLAFDTSGNMFFVSGGACIVLGIYALSLPTTPPPMKGEPVSVGSIIGLDSIKLLKQPPFLVFIIASMLVCIPLAAYYAYAGTYVGASGAFANDEGVTAVGFYMSFGQMSEVLFMLIMPLCFARLGVKWMLLIGMGAWVLRYGLFSSAAGTEGSSAMIMILGGILLHGICYDFFFVTGQIYTDRKAGPKIRGQAQGFLVLVTQGIGMLIGAQIAGKLFAANTTVTDAGDVIDWGAFWLIPCIMAGVIAVLFLALFWDRTKKDDVDADDLAGGAVQETAV